MDLIQFCHPIIRRSGKAVITVGGTGTDAESIYLGTSNLELRIYPDPESRWCNKFSSDSTITMEGVNLFLTSFCSSLVNTTLMLNQSSKFYFNYKYRRRNIPLSLIPIK